MISSLRVTHLQSVCINGINMIFDQFLELSQSYRISALLVHFSDHVPKKLNLFFFRLELHKEFISLPFKILLFIIGILTVCRLVHWGAESCKCSVFLGFFFDKILQKLLLFKITDFLFNFMVLFLQYFNLRKLLINCICQFSLLRCRPLLSLLEFHLVLINRGFQFFFLFFELPLQLQNLLIFNFNFLWARAQLFAPLFFICKVCIQLVV